MAGSVLQPNSAFMQEVRRLALDKIEEYCRPIAQDAVERTDAIVEQLYDTARTGYRTKEGETKLKGSFTGRVNRGPDGIVQISLESSCNPKKLWALERGSKAHEIVGHGKDLVFPRGQTGSVTTGPRKRTKNFFGETGQLVKIPAVTHPGNKAGRFMEQGLASAIQARLRIGRGLTVGGRV